MDSHGNAVRQAEIRTQKKLSTLVIVIAIVAMAGAISTPLTPAISQGVALVKVDVSVLGKGYRASKLIGTGVTNDKNEKIGSLDDLVVDKTRVLFAVLQVGGFLGIGSRLVAIPAESLVIDDAGRKIQLPGATKDQLKSLSEFKYPS
jgi:hypothetical protein